MVNGTLIVMYDVWVCPDLRCWVRDPSVVTVRLSKSLSRAVLHWRDSGVCGSAESVLVVIIFSSLLFRTEISERRRRFEPAYNLIITITPEGTTSTLLSLHHKRLLV